LAGQIIAGAVCASVLVASGVVLHSGAADAAANAYTTAALNVYDSLQGSVSAGFGTAQYGGPYSASPASDFSVGGGAGHIAALGTGASAAVTLPGVSSLNQQLQATFTVPALPAAGRGVYFGLELRRQANGDTYRVRARVQPDGRVNLDLTQVAQNHEVNIGDNVTIYQHVAAGEQVTLEGYVTGSGTAAVNLKARAWLTGTLEPSWQLTKLQTGAKRLLAPGAVGLWIYTSKTSAGIPITVHNLSGWPLVPTAPGPSGGTSSHPAPTPPTTSASAPSSSASPTSSASASTSSSAPTPSPSTTPPSSSSSPQPRPSSSPSSPSTSSSSPTSSPPSSTSPSSTSPGPGQPGPSNTGVPAGTTLTVTNGLMRITKPGVYSGLDIHGFVEVQAPNVTIKDSIIRGGVATGNIGLVNDIDNSATNFVIEDSELVPQYPSVWIDGIKGWNYTAIRLNIHGTVDGAKMYGNNSTIENSWIHDLRYFSSDPNQNGGPTHNDDVQILGGHNLRIINNTLQGGDNSALQVTQSQGSVYSLSFNGNWAGGGSCTVNLQDAPMPSMSGISVNNNVFSHTSTYNCPIIYSINVSFTHAGNTWATGSGAVPVTVRGS
jgi:hypothetical protein